MMCGLSERRSQITFTTTKPSSEVFSLCAAPCKTITGIQQLQIALKFPGLFLWIINESQTKKDKKNKKKQGGEISTACPSSGECYKAVIMPENEKWNKVVGARKDEAETETGRGEMLGWKEKTFYYICETQKVADRHTIKTRTNKQYLHQSVRFVLCESKENVKGSVWEWKHGNCKCVDFSGNIKKNYICFCSRSLKQNKMICGFPPHHNKLVAFINT